MACSEIIKNKYLEDKAHFLSHSLKDPKILSEWVGLDQKEDLEDNDIIVLE